MLARYQCPLSFLRGLQNWNCKIDWTPIIKSNLSNLHVFLNLPLSILNPTFFLLPLLKCLALSSFLPPSPCINHLLPIRLSFSPPPACFSTLLFHLHSPTQFCRRVTQFKTPVLFPLPSVIKNNLCFLGFSGPGRSLPLLTAAFCLWVWEAMVLFRSRRFMLMPTTIVRRRQNAAELILYGKEVRWILRSTFGLVRSPPWFPGHTLFVHLQLIVLVISIINVCFV